MGGILASVQYYLKKIISYSTCSQLGYMMMACGLSMYNLSLFHLFNHAFYKALLFLAAGSVIHIMNGEQDVNRIGGSDDLDEMPGVAFIVGSFALTGTLGFSGFYSKDVIISSANMQLYLGQPILGWAALVGAYFTVVYTMQMSIDNDDDDCEAYRIAVVKSNDITLIEDYILGILCIVSTIGGYLCKDAFIGMGSPFFNNCIADSPADNILSDVEFFPWEMKLLPSVFTFIAVEFCGEFGEENWLFDDIIKGYIVLPAFSLGRHLFEQHEKRLLEAHGPIALINGFNLAIKKLRYRGSN